MRFDNILKKHSLISIITLTVLVALTTLAIVLCLPRESGIHYNAEENKPWTGRLLIAEFDFPVMRSQEDLEEAKKQQLKEFEPYFEKNDSVGEKAINDFIQKAKQDTTGVLSENEDVIVRRLHAIYDKGIMSEQDYLKMSEDSVQQVRIVYDKNSYITQHLQNVTLQKDAYSLIIYNDEEDKDQEKIRLQDLEEFVRPNIFYMQERNDQVLKELMESIAPKIGEVKKGQKIISRGEIVNETTYNIIQSYENAFNEKKLKPNSKITANITLGQTVFVLIFVALFTFYLTIFRPEYLKKTRKLLMLYAMIALFPIAVTVMVKRQMLDVFIIPFAIAPMITRVFFDSRTAFITHATIILISAVALTYQYEFIIIEMAAGMAAIYTLGDMTKRVDLFKSALAATVCAVLLYFSIEAIQAQKPIFEEQNSRAPYLVISGVFLLLAYPLMYVFERLFGFISQITYFELSDSNQPLLRMLSEKAPGTYAHSTIVSNLAAEIASRIGADVLLVRTGALYHDIGKMENPAFFIENQAGYNDPHNRLPEKESAKVIINHVIYGQKLAEKYKLPDVIKGFIVTHHGCGLTGFFYAKYKNAHPDEEVDPAPFTYPGPNPQTKEQAILMMADTVEAATKSLDEYNDATISKKVNELIDKQVKEGYFKECPITFRDIAVAKQVLIERLKGLYHTRIKYPEIESENKKEDEE